MNPADYDPEYLENYPKDLLIRIIKMFEQREKESKNTIEKLKADPKPQDSTANKKIKSK